MPRFVPIPTEVIPTGRIVARAAELLAMPEVEFVHVRSARNTCFQVRVERDV